MASSITGKIIQEDQRIPWTKRCLVIPVSPSHRSLFFQEMWWIWGLHSKIFTPTPKFHLALLLFTEKAKLLETDLPVWDPSMTTSSQKWVQALPASEPHNTSLWNHLYQWMKALCLSKFEMRCRLCLLLGAPGHISMWRISIWASGPCGRKNPFNSFNSEFPKFIQPLVWK